jgi:hypothetical protein
MRFADQAVIEKFFSGIGALWPALAAYRTASYLFLGGKAALAASMTCPAVQKSALR